MLAAAFETSTRTPSVALRAGDLLLETRLSGERPHASDLLPALDELLGRAGARARDVELLVVGTGPGSFTGLRVAAATAYGLARATGAGLFGIPSGEILCRQELAPGEEALVVLDIRQGHFSCAHYRRAAEEVEVLVAPHAAGWDDWTALARRADASCRASGTRLRFFGESALVARTDSHAEPPGRLPEEWRGRLECDRVPSAAVAIELALLRRARGIVHGPREIEPLYLRSFAAKRSTRVGG